MKNSTTKTKSSKRLQIRKMCIRKKVNGNAERPRVSVFISNRNLYAQVIDDSQAKTILSVSKFETEFKDLTFNIETVKKMGVCLAERLKSKGFKTLVYDRNGKLYHGKIKAFADSLRESGMQF